MLIVRLVIYTQNCPEEEAVTVTYKDEPLTTTPESEAVRYLGFWAFPSVRFVPPGVDGTNVLHHDAFV